MTEQRAHAVPFSAPAPMPTAAAEAVIARAAAKIVSRSYFRPPAPDFDLAALLRTGPAVVRHAIVSIGDSEAEDDTPQHGCTEALAEELGACGEDDEAPITLRTPGWLGDRWSDHHDDATWGQEQQRSAIEVVSAGRLLPDYASFPLVVEEVEPAEEATAEPPQLIARRARLRQIVVAALSLIAGAMIVLLLVGSGKGSKPEAAPAGGEAAPPPAIQLQAKPTP